MSGDCICEAASSGVVCLQVRVSLGIPHRFPEFKGDADARATFSVCGRFRLSSFSFFQLLVSASAIHGIC